MNQATKAEKIVKMKLQTAKVLWQEGRKDASFLLLESIHDPRGDDLRERMGFSDDYEVGLSKTAHHFSSVQVAGIAICSAILFFVLGFMLSPDTATNTVIEVPTDNTIVIEPISTATPAPDPLLPQQSLQLTVTSDPHMATALMALTLNLTQQVRFNAYSTARYEGATATAIVRTQAAGN